MERVKGLIESIAAKLPFHSEYLQVSVANMSQEEQAAFERLLAFYMASGQTVNSLTQAYSGFFKEVMKERAYFQKHHAYRYHTLAEVAGSIYNDHRYMDMYMIGLSFSLYLWPEALEIHRWFIQQIQGRSGKRYLEIGPGHGENFVKAMELSDYRTYEAVDLSQASLDATRAYVHFALPDAENITYTLNDFLQFTDEEGYDAIVAGEVLEHVEQPEAFLRRIHALAHRDTFIYVSAAINSPAMDHIYRFHNKEEVFQMIQENGFSVWDYRYVPTGESLKEPEYPSADLAMILRKHAEGEKT